MAEALYSCATCDVPGVLLMTPSVPRDQRGSLMKLVHAETFAALGLPTTFAEVFVSSSRRGVVRGLHLQLPPAAYHKLVCCLSGAVHDVLVDLRAGSPAFGRPFEACLDARDPMIVSIPPGVAHGFAAVRDATVLYATTAAHEPDVDTGVRWDSVDARWPFADPVVSARDSALPALTEFVSPFLFDPRGGVER